jgi:hypothetical protein
LISVNSAIELERHPAFAMARELHVRPSTGNFLVGTDRKHRRPIRASAAAFSPTARKFFGRGAAAAGACSAAAD